MRKILLVVVLVSVLLSCHGNDLSDKINISGKLENGLRVLDIKDGVDFTVYRGDYIIFKLNSKVTFTVPDLEISEVLPKEENEIQYVKMKKSGVYEYTLGSTKGLIKVINLESPNYKEVTADEASKLIKNINPTIIDVRTDGEYYSGYIENASLIPVQYLSQNLEKISQLKDEPILLYCQSGNRSTVAARILIDNGFTKVYNLRYGIGDWKAKGLGIIK